MAAAGDGQWEAGNARFSTNSNNPARFSSFSRSTRPGLSAPASSSRRRASQRSNPLDLDTQRQLSAENELYMNNEFQGSTEETDQSDVPAQLDELFRIMEQSWNLTIAENFQCAELKDVYEVAAFTIPKRLFGDSAETFGDVNRPAGSEMTMRHFNFFIYMLSMFPVRVLGYNRDERMRSEIRQDCNPKSFRDSGLKVYLEVLYAESDAVVEQKQRVDLMTATQRYHLIPFELDRVAEADIAENRRLTNKLCIPTVKELYTAEVVGYRILAYNCNPTIKFAEVLGFTLHVNQVLLKSYSTACSRSRVAPMSFESYVHKFFEDKKWIDTCFHGIIGLHTKPSNQRRQQEAAAEDEAAAAAVLGVDTSESGTNPARYTDDELMRRRYLTRLGDSDTGNLVEHGSGQLNSILAEQPAHIAPYAVRSMSEIKALWNMSLYMGPTISLEEQNQEIRRRDLIDPKHPLNPVSLWSYPQSFNVIPTVNAAQQNMANYIECINGQSIVDVFGQDILRSNQPVIHRLSTGLRYKFSSIARKETRRNAASASAENEDEDEEDEGGYSAVQMEMPTTAANSMSMHMGDGTSELMPGDASQLSEDERAVNGKDVLHFLAVNTDMLSPLKFAQMLLPDIQLRNYSWTLHMVLSMMPSMQGAWREAVHKRQQERKEYLATSQSLFQQLDNTHLEAQTGLSMLTISERDENMTNLQQGIEYATLDRERHDVDITTTNASMNRITSRMFWNLVHVVQTRFGANGTGDTGDVMPLPEQIAMTRHSTPRMNMSQIQRIFRRPPAVVNPIQGIVQTPQLLRSVIYEGPVSLKMKKTLYMELAMRNKITKNQILRRPPGIERQTELRKFRRNSLRTYESSLYSETRNVTDGMRSVVNWFDRNIHTDLHRRCRFRASDFSLSTFNGWYGSTLALVDRFYFLHGTQSLIMLMRAVMNNAFHEYLGLRPSILMMGSHGTGKSFSMDAAKSLSIEGVAAVVTHESTRANTDGKTIMNQVRFAEEAPTYWFMANGDDSNAKAKIETMKTRMSEGVVYIQALQMSKESAERSTATYVTLSSTPHIAATNDDHTSSGNADSAALDRWLVLPWVPRNLLGRDLGEQNERKENVSQLEKNLKYRTDREARLRQALLAHVEKLIAIGTLSPPRQHAGHEYLLKISRIMKKKYHVKISPRRQQMIMSIARSWCIEGAIVRLFYADTAPLRGQDFMWNHLLAIVPYLSITCEHVALAFSSVSRVFFRDLYFATLIVLKEYHHREVPNEERWTRESIPAGGSGGPPATSMTSASSSSPSFAHSASPSSATGYTPNHGRQENTNSNDGISDADDVGGSFLNESRAMAMANAHIPTGMGVSRTSYDMARFPKTLRELSKKVAEIINNRRGMGKEINVESIRDTDVYSTLLVMKDKRTPYTVGMQLDRDEKPVPGPHSAASSGEVPVVEEKNEVVMERQDKCVLIPTSFLYQKHSGNCNHLILDVLQEAAPNNGYVMRVLTGLAEDECPEIVPTTLVVPFSPTVCRDRFEERGGAGESKDGELEDDESNSDSDSGDVGSGSGVDEQVHHQKPNAAHIEECTGNLIQQALPVSVQEDHEARRSAMRDDNDDMAATENENIHHLVPVIGQRIAQSAAERYVQEREKTKNVPGGFFGASTGIGARENHPVEQAMGLTAQRYRRQMDQWWTRSMERTMDDEQRSIAHAVRSETSPRAGEYYCYMMLYHSKPQELFEQRQRLLNPKAQTMKVMVYDHCIRHNVVLQQLRNRLEKALKQPLSKRRSLLHTVKREYQDLVERVDKGIEETLCMWRMQGVPAVGIADWYAKLQRYFERRRQPFSQYFQLETSTMTPAEIDAARFPELDLVLCRSALPAQCASLKEVGEVIQNMTDSNGALRWDWVQMVALKDLPTTLRLPSSLQTFIRYRKRDRMFRQKTAIPSPEKVAAAVHFLWTYRRLDFIDFPRAMQESSGVWGEDFNLKLWVQRLERILGEWKRHRQQLGMHDAVTMENSEEFDKFVQEFNDRNSTPDATETQRHVHGNPRLLQPRAVDVDYVFEGEEGRPRLLNQLLSSVSEDQEVASSSHNVMPSPSQLLQHRVDQDLETVVSLRNNPAYARLLNPRTGLDDDEDEDDGEAEIGSSGGAAGGGGAAAAAASSPFMSQMNDRNPRQFRRTPTEEEIRQQNQNLRNYFLEEYRKGNIRMSLFPLRSRIMLQEFMRKEFGTTSYNEYVEAAGYSNIITSASSIASDPAVENRDEEEFDRRGILPRLFEDEADEAEADYQSGDSLDSSEDEDDSGDKNDQDNGTFFESSTPKESQWQLQSVIPASPESDDDDDGDDGDDGDREVGMDIEDE